MKKHNVEGFLLLDKPSGITSFGCLRRIKRLFTSKYKIGHGGTLDSFASGLLVVGISRAATKHMNELLRLDKQYETTGVLGASTDTMDRTGDILQQCEGVEITPETVATVVQSFLGAYEQIPPIFSALKHKGSRLSDLVRSGEMTMDEVAVLTGHKVRTVSIYDIKITNLALPEFTIAAHVSHGTYMRSLIADIGQRLDSCAYTSALTRTAVGPFALGQATALASLDSLQALSAALIPVDDFLQQLQAYRQEGLYGSEAAACSEENV